MAAMDPHARLPTPEQSLVKEYIGGGPLAT
jgi:hypothetical protein